LKIISTSFLCFATIIVCGSTSAHATIAQLTCSSTSGSSISTNVSYYDLGVASATNIGSQGAGAGKVVFNPLVVHISLANFQKLLPVVTAGGTFSSCTLMSNTGGNNIQHDLRLVTVSSIDAIAENPRTDQDEPSAYTKVAFQYGDLQVHVSNSLDDGGTHGEH
jgi:hypothetical protein